MYAFNACFRDSCFILCHSLQRNEPLKNEIEITQIKNRNDVDIKKELSSVLDIFDENFPNLDAQEVKAKAEAALNSMIGIVDSTEGTLDESLKIDYLIEQGFNVVVPIN